MLSFSSSLNTTWKNLNGVKAFNAILMAMSTIVARLLATYPIAEEQVVDGDDYSWRQPNANVGLRGERPSIQRRVTFCDLDSEGDTFFDCQEGVPSDSWEDFRTPHADDSGPEINVREGERGVKKFFQFFADGYWDDHLTCHRKVVTVYKETKLVQFLQDSSWVHKLVRDRRSSRSVGRRKHIRSCGKHPDDEESSREPVNNSSNKRKKYMGKLNKLVASTAYRSLPPRQVSLNKFHLQFH